MKEQIENRQKRSCIYNIHLYNSTALLIGNLLIVGFLVTAFIFIYLDIIVQEYFVIQRRVFQHRQFTVSSITASTAQRSNQYFSRYQDILTQIMDKRQLNPGPVATPTPYDHTNFLANLLDVWPISTNTRCLMRFQYIAGPIGGTDNLQYYGFVYPVVRGIMQANAKQYNDISYIQFIKVSTGFLVVHPSGLVPKLTAAYSPVTQPYYTAALAAGPRGYSMTDTGSQIVFCMTDPTIDQLICLHTIRSLVLQPYTYDSFSNNQFLHTLIDNNDNVVVGSVTGSIKTYLQANLTTYYSQFVADILPVEAQTTFFMANSQGLLDSSVAYAYAFIGFAGTKIFEVMIAYYQDYTIKFLEQLQSLQKFRFLIVIGLVGFLFIVDYIILVYFQYRIVEQFLKQIEIVTFKMKGANLNEMDVDLKNLTNFTEIDEMRTKLQRIVVLRRVLCPVFYENKDQLLLRYRQALAQFQRSKDYKRMGIIQHNNGLIKLRQGQFQDSQVLINKSINYLQIFYSETYKIPNLPSFMDSKEHFAQLAKYFVGHQADYAEFQQVYSCRLYILAIAMIRQAAKTHQIQKKLQAIKILKKVGILQQGKFRERQIQALFHRLLISINIENKEQTNQLMKQIRDKIYTYEGVYFNFLQHKKHIPPQIFTQQLEFIVAKYYRDKVKDNHNSVLHLKNSITVGRFYDKKLRIQALKMLTEIYNAEQMSSKVVERLLNIESQEASNRKDIVFLLDFSNSMERTKRKYYAIKLIIELIKNFLNKEDNVCLITFNYKVQTIFELMNKSENQEMIESALLKLSKEPAVGQTCLYQAIYQGLNQLNKSHHEDSIKIVLCFTDGADNCSSINLQKIASYIKLFRNPKAGNGLSNNSFTLSFLGFQLAGGLQKPIQALAECTQCGSYMRATFDFSTDSLFCAQMIRSFNDNKEDQQHLNLQQL